MNPMSALHRHLSVLAALTALAACGAAPPAAAATGTTTPSTDCDRLASHPDDPQRVADGVGRGQIDLPVATAACERAVVSQPSDARGRYQLARLLFYAGQNVRAVAEMRRAADDGYAQAQFVFGTFIVRARPGAPTDPCLAESYWRRSAAGGRQAARVQYLRYTLQGRFAACTDVAPQAEQRTMLEAATAAASDFYETLVVEDLRLAFAARRSGAGLGAAAGAAWSRCVATLGLAEGVPVGERRLGVTPESTRTMNSLILGGEKTITTTSPWLYAADPAQRPVVGAYSVLLEADGRAVAVLRTTLVKELPYDQVTEEDSRFEGPPVRPLAAWREVHVRFFNRELQPLGRQWDAQMPVTLERFEVACGP